MCLDKLYKWNYAGIRREKHFRTCRKLTRDGRKPVKVVSFSGFGEGKGSRFDILKLENEKQEAVFPDCATCSTVVWSYVKTWFLSNHKHPVESWRQQHAWHQVIIAEKNIDFLQVEAVLNRPSSTRFYNLLNSLIHFLFAFERNKYVKIIVTQHKSRPVIQKLHIKDSPVTSSPPYVVYPPPWWGPAPFAVHLRAQVNRPVFITSALRRGDDAAGIDAPELPSAVAALRTHQGGFTPVQRGERHFVKHFVSNKLSLTT